MKYILRCTARPRETYRPYLPTGPRRRDLTVNHRSVRAKKMKPETTREIHLSAFMFYCTYFHIPVPLWRTTLFPRSRGLSGVPPHILSGPKPRWVPPRLTRPAPRAALIAPEPQREREGEFSQKGTVVCEIRPTVMYTAKGSKNCVQ